MTEIEKIQRYIARTKIKDAPALGMRPREWVSIGNSGSTLDAVALAFEYGRAKGYRAAKAERKAVAK